MDPGVVVIIALCVLLLLWYGAAYLYNHRRGERLYRWIEAGLDVLGGEREAGWIGSPASGARFNIVHAASPFRRLEITLLLDNREVLPLWLIRRLRGEQDWLIIRATLRSPHQCEVEILPPTGQIARGLRKERDQPWTWQNEVSGMAIAYRGSGAQRHIASLQPWLQTYGHCLHRFSWRKTDPHIQLQVKIAMLLTISIAEFLADLQAALKPVTHTDH
jgi:hypothetical protein